jgi:3-deoxy-7-phosphoheptulonate synthase
MFSEGCNAFASNVLKLTMPIGTFTTWVSNPRSVSVAEHLLLEMRPLSGECGMLKPIPGLMRVGREQKPDDTIVHVGGVAIGGRRIVMIAGPCAVESADQMLATARAVKDAGAAILRGGVYKPRTSPYSFRGLKDDGLQIIADVKRETGLPVVTEAMDARHLDAVCARADMIQIGSRNMQNYTLLEEVGKLRMPVLLKRGFSATIEEFLFAAEYVASGGNDQIVLCERGIRTFETSTRNTLDLSAVPILKKLSHLPVIVDPSHGTGIWWLVPLLARAAVAVGADGLLVEVHVAPEQALSDGEQSLRPDKFTAMMADLRPVALAIGREI